VSSPKRKFFIIGLVLAAFWLCFLPAGAARAGGSAEMTLDSSDYMPGATVTVILNDPDCTESIVVVQAGSFVSLPIYVNLEQISPGEYCGVFTLSEPGAGSDDDSDILGVGNNGQITVKYDADGNGQYDDLSATAYVDGIKPVLSFTVPANGASGVSFDTQPLIEVAFSEKILEGDQFDQITVRDSDSNQVVSGIQKTIDFNKLIINHGNYLVCGTEYTVEISAGAVHDRAGNPNNAVVFHFTTRPAREFHVSTAGSDAAGDGTESNPYGTVAGAMSMAMHGDSVVVHDGTYTENITVDKNVIVISLHGRDKTVIQPAAGSGFNLRPAPGVDKILRITGFTVSGAVYGVQVTGMQGGAVYIENNTVSGCTDGIFIDEINDGDIFIQKNDLSGNSGSAVRLGACEGGAAVTVQWNNIVYNGVGLVSDGTNPVDARLNYWNNPHGPSASGVNYGDTVVGNVDFAPWLVGPVDGTEIAPPLSIVAPALPDGYLGLDYLAELPEQGSSGACQWSVYSGGLPDGLELAEGRYVHGTPGEIGTYAFALEANDGTQALYHEVSLTIQPAPDLEPPGVVEKTPGDGAEGVSLNTVITVEFTEPVYADANWGGITVTAAGGAAVPCSGIISGSTLSINLDGLNEHITYIVTVPAGSVRDAVGNATRADIAWSFTTGEAPDTTPPEPVVAQPSAGGLYNGPVTVSGAVYEKHLAAVEVAVRSVAEDVYWDDAGNAWTSIETWNNAQITGQAPNFAFAYQVPAGLDGDYMAFIRAVDGSGNLSPGIQVEYTLDFTAPGIMHTNPGDGARDVAPGAPFSVVFDEPVAAANLEAVHLVDCSTGADVSAEYNLQAALDTAAATLAVTHSPLANGGEYTLHIPAGVVVDRAGNGSGEVAVTFIIVEEMVEQPQQPPDSGSDNDNNNDEQNGSDPDDPSPGGNGGTDDDNSGTSSGQAQYKQVPRQVITFADIQGHWAQKDIEMLAGIDIIRGDANGNFAPDRAITRAEFTALLVRALGIPEVGNNGGWFGDVRRGAWYYGTIAAAGRAGLVSGFDDGAFRPGEPITRQQMAALVVRALRAAGHRVAVTPPERAALLSRFNDRAAISAWAVDEVAVAVKADIVRGVAENILAPGATATRAQAVVAVKRLMKLAGLL